MAKTQVKTFPSKKISSAAKKHVEKATPALPAVSSAKPEKKLKKKKKARQKRAVKNLIKTQRSFPAQYPGKKTNKEGHGLSLSCFRKLVKSTLSQVVNSLNSAAESSGSSKCKVERFKKEAYFALKEGAEDKLVELFRFANERAVSNGRQTVELKDYNPEVTRAFAPHVYSEPQGTERSALGLKNVTGYRNPNFVAEQDFMYIIGKKKERASKENEEEAPAAEEDAKQQDDDKKDEDKQNDSGSESGFESE